MKTGFGKAIDTFKRFSQFGSRHVSVNTSLNNSFILEPYV